VSGEAARGVVVRTLSARVAADAVEAALADAVRLFDGGGRGVHGRSSR
jgi:hypothetical protein